MKSLFRILTAVLVVLTLSCSGESDNIKWFLNSVEANRDAVRSMGDYGTVTVMGHSNEDPDAVCSAVCMAELMRGLGTDATAYVHVSPNRGVRYILDRFAYEYPKVKTSVLEDEPVLLTDHNDPLQSVSGITKANVVGIVDHHAVSSAFQTSGPIYYKALSVGSSNTVVYTIYQECNVEPSAQIAGILASGIIADTDNLAKSSSTVSDSLALVRLLRIAGINDRQKLADEIAYALTDYSGMTDVEILNSDLKKYNIEGVDLAVADTAASDSFTADGLCNRLRGVMPDQQMVLGVQMLFCMVRDAGNNLTHIAYCGTGAKEVAEEAFGPTTHDNCVVVDGVLVRKSDVIPAITEVLNRWKQVTE